MLRDYLTKLAILSQYSGPADALIVEESADKNAQNATNGSGQPKTTRDITSATFDLSEENAGYVPDYLRLSVTERIQMEVENERFMLAQVGALFPANPTVFSACHVNPAYLGNPSEDR